MILIEGVRTHSHIVYYYIAPTNFDLWQCFMCLRDYISSFYYEHNSFWHLHLRKLSQLYNGIVDQFVTTSRAIYISFTTAEAFPWKEFSNEMDLYHRSEAVEP